jgi:uncharacterized protein (TIGR02246 family)
MNHSTPALAARLAFAFTLATLLWSPPLASAQEAGQEAPHEREIAALRDRLIEAANTNDPDNVLPLLSENVVVTWQNADVSRGRAGVRAYFDRMLKAPGHLLAGFSVEATSDGPPVAYGDRVAVLSGRSSEEYRLASGTHFRLNGRWTATVVREGDQWLVASLHSSTGIYENPLVHKMKQLMYLGLAIVAVIVVAVGVLFFRLPTMRRRAE